MFGAIEAGGTKFVCAVGSAADIGETARFETRDVDATLADVTGFFRAAATRHGPIAALGIGSFGPLQLDRAAPDYGRITTTPKPGWSGADMPARLGAALGVPVAIDTDVNAAALAEIAVGAGRGRRTLAYVTVGTASASAWSSMGRPSMASVIRRPAT